MFPIRSCPQPTRDRLGYRRGDVPLGPVIGVDAVQVGLQARGCSPFRSWHRGKQCGWATGAGMFPSQTRPPRREARLGYRRGDVPVSFYGSCFTFWVGLQARGCSVNSQFPEFLRGGWATGAGMFLIWQKFYLGRTWLGYRRGDVPLGRRSSSRLRRVGLQAQGCSPWMTETDMEAFPWNLDLSGWDAWAQTWCCG